MREDTAVYVRKSFMSPRSWNKMTEVANVNNRETTTSSYNNSSTVSITVNLPCQYFLVFSRQSRTPFIAVLHIIRTCFAGFPNSNSNSAHYLINFKNRAGLRVFYGVYRHWISGLVPPETKPIQDKVKDS